jgi:hypothetical protein
MSRTLGQPFVIENRPGSRHQKFFCKNVFHTKATPFMGRTIFGQVFVRGGISNFQNPKVPPTGGSHLPHAHQAKLPLGGFDGRVVLPRAGVGQRLTDEMPRTTHPWVCLARRKCDKHYRGGKARQGKARERQGKGAVPARPFSFAVAAHAPNTNERTSSVQGRPGGSSPQPDTPPLDGDQYGRMGSDAKRGHWLLIELFKKCL